MATKLSETMGQSLKRTVSDPAVPLWDTCVCRTTLTKNTSCSTAVMAQEPKGLPGRGTGTRGNMGQLWEVQGRRVCPDGNGCRDTMWSGRHSRPSVRPRAALQKIYVLCLLGRSCCDRGLVSFCTLPTALPFVLGPPFVPAEGQRGARPRTSLRLCRGLAHRTRRK